MAKRPGKRRRARRGPDRKGNPVRLFFMTLIVVGLVTSLAVSAWLGGAGFSDSPRRSARGPNIPVAGRGDPHALLSVNAPEESSGAPDCPRGRTWTASPDGDAPRIPEDATDREVEELADALSNVQRREAGLPELEYDETLRDIGRAHSQQMSELDFFSHEDPEGRGPGDRLHGWHRRLVGEAGENIWMCRDCWRGNPDALVDTMLFGSNGWMNSPGHRANILRGSFTHVAIGVARHGDDVWATQVFSTTKGYLFEALPKTIKSGDCLLVELNPYPETGRLAAFFDLQASTGQASIKRSGLGFKQVDAEAGQHQLRFYFPTGAKRFSVVRGPRIAVE